MILKILNIIAFLFGIYIVKLGLDRNKTKELEVLPEDILLPEELNFLYKDITYLNRAIVTTLLNLYSRGKIDIEKYVRDSRNKKLEDFVVEYKFTLLDDTGLKDHELYFLENIFEDKSEVTTDELTQRAIDGQTFYKKQGKWANMLEAELKEIGIYENKEKKKSNILKVIGLLILLIGIISFVNEEILGLLSVLAASGILLVAINMGMDKSLKGKKILNHFTDIEVKAKKFEEFNNLSEEELINLLALTLTMKYFLPIYKNSKNYDSIDIISESINEYGGSYFDDAILRGFMAFTAKTRDDTLDTNRIDYRLFK